MQIIAIHTKGKTFQFEKNNAVYNGAYEIQNGIVGISHDGTLTVNESAAIHDAIRSCHRMDIEVDELTFENNRQTMKLYLVELRNGNYANGVTLPNGDDAIIATAENVDSVIELIGDVYDDRRISEEGVAVVECLGLAEQSGGSRVILTTKQTRILAYN